MHWLVERFVKRDSGHVPDDGAACGGELVTITTDGRVVCDVTALDAAGGVPAVTVVMMRVVSVIVVVRRLSWGWTVTIDVSWTVV